MNVSACLVTRGNVDMQPVLDSLPADWQKVVWANGVGVETWTPEGWEFVGGGNRYVVGPGGAHGVTLGPGRLDLGLGEPPPQVWPDLSVYGRYQAIQHATADVIYVQDDDCIVSDPQAIVWAWYEAAEHPDNFNGEQVAVCNMPQEFRHDFYTEHALVGFGAAFHRGRPQVAFEQFVALCAGTQAAKEAMDDLPPGEGAAWFNRTCDIVFTGLTPTVLVDVSHTDREFASDPDRMWRQPEHTAERQRMRDLVAKVSA